ncbi:MAG TPA: TraY domain-containing protein [Cyclobacteriaceae bacterium]
MKDESITIRIDAETLNRLRELAEKDQRTLSNYIRLVLTKHIEKV